MNFHMNFLHRKKGLEQLLSLVEEAHSLGNRHHSNDRAYSCCHYDHRDWRLWNYVCALDSNVVLDVAMLYHNRAISVWTRMINHCSRRGNRLKLSGTCTDPCIAIIMVVFWSTEAMN